MDDIRVRYDPQHGYPLEVIITTKPTIADGGVTDYARNLQAIPMTIDAGGS